jgi:hypothetical protein
MPNTPVRAAAEGMPKYLDSPPPGWFPLSICKQGPGRKWDWTALMVDVHPDELKHYHCGVSRLFVHPAEYKPIGNQVAREAWFRIPGKHRSEDSAWDALCDMLPTPGH